MPEVSLEPRRSGDWWGEGEVGWECGVVKQDTQRGWVMFVSLNQGTYVAS